MPLRDQNGGIIKWTPENKRHATGTFKRAIKILKDNEEMYSLACVAVELNTYKGIFNYIISKYTQDEKTYQTLLSLKKELLNIIESRLVKLAIKKQNPASPIFLLKANHGLIEQQKVDVTSSDGSLRVPKLTAKEAKEIKNKYLKVV